MFIYPREEVLAKSSFSRELMKDLVSFNMRIHEATDNSLKGSLSLRCDFMTSEGCDFCIKRGASARTPECNVSYHTYMSLEVELL